MVTQEMPRRNQKRDIVIAVIGVTGAGKTTFVSRATGRTDLKIGHSIDSFYETGTQDVTPVTFTLDGRNVTLIDTPGFDDSERSDADILALVASHMFKTYEEGMLLTGIIFVQPINQQRLLGSEVRRNCLFKKILGEDAYSRVIIATTMWNQVLEAEAMSRMEQRRSREDVWGDMVRLGALVRRHDDNEASAKAIVKSLMVFSSPVELQLQKELKNTDGRVVLTSAGKQLDEDLGELISKLRSEIEELKKEQGDMSEELEGMRKKLEALEQEKMAANKADAGACGSCVVM